jgi:hypothetical protein
MKTTGVLLEAFASSICLFSRSEIDPMLYLTSVDETGVPFIAGARTRVREGDLVE